MVAKSGSPVRTRMTVADYDALPDDGPRCELIDGVLIEMPTPTPLHQAVQFHFHALIYFFVAQRGLGRVFGAPLDVQLSGRIVQPDVLYISTERIDIITDRRIVGSPDLVLEVSSQLTRDYDQDDKRELYRMAGVREYWFIDVEKRTATVWALVGDRYVEQRPDEQGQHVSTVLPGFVVNVAAALISVAEE